MLQAYEKSFRLAIFNRTDAGELDLGVPSHPAAPACLHPVPQVLIAGRYSSALTLCCCRPSAVACRADDLEAGSPLEVCSYLVHPVPTCTSISFCIPSKKRKLESIALSGKVQSQFLDTLLDNACRVCCGSQGTRCTSCPRSAAPRRTS